MKKVLVAGATGYLGKHIVAELKSRGYWVRAITRNKRKSEAITNFYDSLVTAEVTRPETLSGICKGIDVVISCVGITKQKDGLSYNDVDYRANRNLLEEAKNAGVSRFIYISVFNADKLSHLKSVAAKIKFENELKNSSLEYTIISPNGFFSDMLEFLQMARKGKGFVFGSGEYRINPIHGLDLAEVCVNAIDRKDTEIEVGGPEVYTHNEILSIAFDTVQKPYKVSSVPLWLRNMILSIMRLITPVRSYGPVEFFMTVLAMDMVAPAYGKRRLDDFFQIKLDSSAI